jgi:RNA polymerase sigma factor (sigma-70 family)
MTRHMKMVRQLRTALDRLPPEGREALYLRYYESLPVEEIAGRLGMKTNQAAALIDRALQHVSKIYVDEF